MMPFAVLNTYEETCAPFEKFPGAPALKFMLIGDKGFAYRE
jgi:hypothetical protein